MQIRVLYIELVNLQYLLRQFIMVTTTIRNVYLTKPWGVLELKFYDVWMILLITRAKLKKE